MELGKKSRSIISRGSLQGGRVREGNKFSGSPEECAKSTVGSFFKKKKRLKITSKKIVYLSSL